MRAILVPTSILLLSVTVSLFVPACHQSQADKDARARKSALTVGEEAYVLPPLSSFEPFPADISIDLQAKCDAANLPLQELRRSKDDGRQSVYAVFNNGEGTIPQGMVLSAFRVLGTNFVDVARMVVNFPVAGSPNYFVASGTKLQRYLTDSQDSEKSATALETFWNALEHEVTPEPDKTSATSGDAEDP
ncbi:MAG: hypothetical protein ABI743_05910 [bacterium]